jgi:tetratricopeptide (TPR) repeat protein
MKKHILLITLIFFTCRGNHESNTEVKTFDSLSAASMVRIDSSLIATSADLYYSVKAYDSALIEYERLIAIDSTNGRYQYRTGVCKARLRRPKEAVKHFITSAKLNYRVKDSYETLGMTYYILLREDSLALHYFKKAQKVQYDPEIQKFIDKLNGKPRDNTTI